MKATYTKNSKYLLPYTIFAVLLLICSSLFISCGTSQRGAAAGKPNIILIYTDDLGYGDVGCYGATGVKTPNIDYLAQNGIRFTDAHSSASTCTPSRYSVLTGSYAFRNNAAILPGSAPLLIQPGTRTLPAMLQNNGYTTAVIGKWHLGLGNGTPAWNEELKPGPLEVGFNYCFIVPATLDRVPTVFVENHHVANLDPGDPISISYEHKTGDLPTGAEHPEMTKMRADSQHSGTIVDSISRIGFMSGGERAWWKDQAITQTMVDRVKGFIHQNSQRPFFLYFAATDVHVPRDPDPQFKGKSSMGARGDAIAELDWSVGAILEILKQENLTQNTLIIFSSDNGPILDDGYDDLAEELIGDDKPWGPFNGGKYSAFEGGTRVPTVVYWQGKIKAQVSDALFSHVDFYASLAKMTGYELAPNEAPDSYDMSDVLIGRSNQGRGTMLEESYTLSLRMNNWKYIAPKTKPIPDWLQNKKVATGLSTTPQLYNLEADIAEQNNEIGRHPEQAEKMKKILEKIQEEEGTRSKFQSKIAGH